MLLNSTFKNEIRLLWLLAWPVLIGQLATVGMSVADITMVGHFHKDELAAVSLGSSLWVIIMVTVVGVMFAVNTVVAHEVGAKNFDRIPQMMQQSFWVAIGVGCIAWAILITSTFIFDYLNMSQTVLENAKKFVYAISFGMPAIALYRTLYCYSASLNQTKPVMFIAIGALIFNVFLNWILIYGKLGLPQLGAVGCAIATVISMWFMFFVMVFWVRFAKVYQPTYPFKKFEKPDLGFIKHILKIGVPIGLTYFIEVSTFCVIALLIAHFGVIQVSANQIALNLSSLLFMIPMSLGVAQITRVSQTLGENNFRLARYISLLGIWVSLAFSSISVFLIIKFRHTIAAIYTSDPDVQKVAASLLLIVGIFQFSDGLQVIAASALRGYKNTFKPMIIHLLAFYIFAIPLGYILAIAPDWSPFQLPQPLGVTGYWIGLTIGLTISALLQVTYLNHYSKNKL